MSGPDLDRIRQDIRRTQIGAAIGATGVSGAAFELLQQSFPAALSELSVLTSRDDLVDLEVRTVVQEGATVLEWLEESRAFFQLSAEQEFALEAVAQRGSGSLVVGMRETRSGEPSLVLGRFGDRSSTEVLGHLGATGVSERGRIELDQALTLLPERRVNEWCVRVSRGGGVRFEVSVPFTFGEAGRDLALAALGAAWERGGAPEGQRRWLHAVASRLSRRPENPVTARWSVQQDGLGPGFGCAFVQVPDTLALQVLTGVFGADGLGTRLGALSGIANSQAVSELRLVGGPWDRPHVHATWILRQPGIS